MAEAPPPVPPRDPTLLAKHFSSSGGVLSYPTVAFPTSATAGTREHSSQSLAVPSTHIPKVIFFADGVVESPPPLPSSPKPIFSIADHDHSDDAGSDSDGERAEVKTSYYYVGAGGVKANKAQAEDGAWGEDVVYDNPTTGYSKTPEVMDHHKLAKLDKSSEKLLNNGLSTVMPQVTNVREVIHSPIHTKFSDWLFDNGWVKLLTYFLFFYFLVITLFGGLLVIGEAMIQNKTMYRSFSPNADDENIAWEDCFLLSMQTFSTVGYGSLQPIHPWTHLVVGLEMFTSIIFTSIVGGGIFLKIVRPVPRIAFSKFMCIAATKGNKPRLQFRAVMGEGFRLYYTRAQMEVHMILRDAKTNSIIGLKNETLKLEFEEHNFVSVAAIFTHTIDETSALFGLDHTTLPQYVQKVSFVMQGDESRGFMTLYSGRTWGAHEILFNHQFSSLFVRNEDDSNGSLGSIDASLLHNVERIAVASLSKNGKLGDKPSLGGGRANVSRGDTLRMRTGNKVSPA